MNQIILRKEESSVDDDKEKYMKGDNYLMKYLAHCEVFTDYIMNQLHHDKVIQECTEKEVQFQKCVRNTGHTKRQNDCNFFNEQFKDHSGYK